MFKAAFCINRRLWMQNTVLIHSVTARLTALSNSKFSFWRLPNRFTQFATILVRSTRCNGKTKTQRLLQRTSTTDPTSESSDLSGTLNPRYKMGSAVTIWRPNTWTFDFLNTFFVRLSNGLIKLYGGHFRPLNAHFLSGFQTSTQNTDHLTNEHLQFEYQTSVHF